VSNFRLIIVIWGAAILVYLGVTHSGGAVAITNALSGLGTKSTRTLQGR
jgi:hypothetical protein